MFPYKELCIKILVYMKMEREYKNKVWEILLHIIKM